MTDAHRGGEDDDLRWVKTADKDRLLGLVRSLRDPDIGDDPGHALKILNAMGVLRDAENLVAEASSFQDWDRELILAGAALQRDVTQAAALLIALGHQPDNHDAQTNPQALGMAIVAEIARQRVAVECTQLIGILLAESSDPGHGAWAQSLVAMLVTRFALGDGAVTEPGGGAGDGRGSGGRDGGGRGGRSVSRPREGSGRNRSHLGEEHRPRAKRLGRPERDLVLFYASLRGAGHWAEADSLLNQTLCAENKAEDLRSLAREFEHFVPRRDVLATWLAGMHKLDREAVITVAAALLTEEGPLPEAVVAAVAGTWPAVTVTSLCGTLKDDRAAQAILQRVGEGLPTDAADVVYSWLNANEDEAVIQRRLDAVVGAGSPDPVSLSHLTEIVRSLRSVSNSGPLCTRFLRRAAVSVHNRNGRDLVALLWMINDVRLRRETAFEAADGLAACAKPEVAIDYVRALEDRGDAEARRYIDFVLDALTDRYSCDADVVAEVAAGLWRDPATRVHGEQLAKQHLRNEHAIKGADVVTVLRRLRALPESVLSTRERRGLLHDTVALWSPVRLDDAWAALSTDPDPSAELDKEALATRW